MPRLQGEAKEAYIKNYGDETYNKYTDTTLDTYHGGTYVDTDSPSDVPIRFSHRPDHDMESMFWVLAFALLLAKPLGVPDQITPIFTSAWSELHSHVATTVEGCDG